MKAKLFQPLSFLLIMLSCISSSGQGPQKIITINSDHNMTPFPTLVYTPIGYSTSGQNYPLIVFLHGTGEASGTAVNDPGYLAGNYLGNIYNSSSAGGPAYYIASGQWPDSFANPTTGVYSHYIVISPQAPGWSTAGSQLNYIISNFIAAGYRVDVNRIYVTGLSAGGQGVIDYVNHNGVTPIYEAAAVIPMSMATGTDSAGAQIAAGNNIRAWGFGSDPSDVHGVATHQQMDIMNFYSPGIARFTNYSGGHCCWGQFYTPTYKEVINGKSMNIYQWMLLSSRGAVAPAGSTPTANAGAAQSIQLPVSQASLSGSGSTDAGGTITTYAWSQQSGPSTATIATPSAVTTSVTGLKAGVYVFKLTITDNNGKVSSANVNVTVNPGITNLPPPLPPPGTCGGKRKPITLTGDDQGHWITPAIMPLNPGDTLVVSSKYRWSYLSGDGFHGTASCPIVIMNDTGQVEMTAGIAFSNSTYMHVTGTGSAKHFYGFYIHSYPSVNPVSRGNSLQFSGRTAHMEVDHIDEYLRTYCMWLKEEADCPDSLQYPNWHIDNISIHDIRAKNINQDGFYLGSTSPNGERSISCNGVSISPIPLRLSNIHIYNIILDSVGRSGIQMSGADSGVNEINNCHVTRTGFEFNPQQGSGIILGGYTHGYVHDNYIRQTYQNGIFCLGAGLQRVENNDIDSSGYLNGVKNPGFSNIAADTRLTTNQGATPKGINSTVYIKNNLTGLSSNQDPATLAIYNIDIGLGYYVYPTWNNDNIICNNLIKSTGAPAVVRVNKLIGFSSNCGVTTPNKPPVANAGPAKTITLPVNTVTLTGSGIDSDGTVASYKWTWVSGPAQYTFVSPATPQAVIDNLVQGVYTFRLTVTDNLGATGSATIQVTVNAPAAPGHGSCGGKRKMLEISGNDQGQWITEQNNNIHPGDTLVLSSKYRWTYLSGDGLHGTASCPIVITNDTGQIEMTAGIAFSNSTHLHITGTGSARYFYGFNIHSYENIVAWKRGNSIQLSDRSAFCEIDHIDEYMKANSLVIKEEAMCADSLNAPNWQLDNFSIHDMRSRNISYEGIYLGSMSTNGEATISCNGVSSSPIPMRLSNIKVYNIIMDSVGSNAIQLSGADSGANEIYNCKISRSGLLFDPEQGAGIYLGGYTTAYVHDNHIRSTFQNGISCYGAGLMQVENNNIDSSGFLSGRTNAGVSSIAADTRLTTNKGATPAGILSTISLKNNIVGRTTNTAGAKTGYRSMDIGLSYLSFPTWSAANVICSNVLQNGTTAAEFRINPAIVYTANCSGVAGADAIPLTMSAKGLALEEPGTNSFVIYPNPVHDACSIRLSNSNMGNMLVLIVDAMGVVRRQYNYNKSGQSIQMDLYTGDLAAGTYFIRVQIGLWSEMGKIVKW